MKCPKCGYVSHDYLNACRKCSIDLVDFKAQMQLYSIKAGDINLTACLSDMEPTFATAPGIQDAYFASAMLVDSDTDDTFDISLDDDLNISPMSMSLDESGNLSRILFPAKPGADDETTPSGPFDRGSLGPPQSGYATIMLDVSSFNATPSDTVSDTPDPSTRAVEQPEPGDDAGDDATKPLSAPTTADPTRSADIVWHEDMTAADELSPRDESKASTYELSIAEVSPLESDATALPLHAPDTEETSSDEPVSDTEIPMLLEFDLDSDQSGMPPEDETLLDDIGPEELLPDLPDGATDEPSPVAPMFQAETLIETFETLHDDAVLPDLPIPETEHTTTKAPAFDDATIIVDEDVPSDSPSSGYTTIQLDVDPFADRQATDDDGTPSDQAPIEPHAHETRITDDEESSDDSENMGIVMPALEWDNQVLDMLPTEQQTLADEDPTASEDKAVMPDLPELSLDTTVTPEDATLVDDLLASDIGLNFDTDPLDLANWQLPGYTRGKNDPDETPAEDEGEKPNDAQ